MRRRGSKSAKLDLNQGDELDVGDRSVGATGIEMTIVLPVIHHHSDDASFAAADIAFAAGCPGVFLIHMGGRDAMLDAPARAIKAHRPDKFVGTNRLSMEPAAAIRHDASLGLDGTWSDSPGISTLPRFARDLAPISAAIAEAQAANPAFAFFASVAFKYQPAEPDPAAAALIATAQGWIATTSGEGTGVAADMGKLSTMRAALRTAPLAIASGVTPENVAEHARYVSHILVATGISYPDRDEFNPARLAKFMMAIA